MNDSAAHEHSQPRDSISISKRLDEYEILRDLRSAYKEFLYWAKKQDASHNDQERLNTVNNRISKFLREKAIILGKSNRFLSSHAPLIEQDRLSMQVLIEAVRIEREFILSQKKPIVDELENSN